MSVTSELRERVVQNPLDAGARAVYADALLQEGDPRGQYITLAMALEGRLSPDKRESAKHECKVLLDTHGAKWLKAAEGWAEVRWKGGFVHAIRATARDFVAQGEALVAAEPVMRVVLQNASNEDVESLAKSKAIAHVDQLSIWGSFTDKSAVKLAQSEHAKNLRSLNLSGNDLGAKFTEAAKSLASLTSLCLTGMGIGDEGLGPIASISTLERLFVARCELSDEGVATFVEGDGLGNLQLLCLGGNEITDEACEALAKSNLEKLASLELNQTEIGDEGANAIGKSKTLTSLKRLDLRQTGVSNATLNKLRKKMTVIGHSWS